MGKSIFQWHRRYDVAELVSFLEYFEEKTATVQETSCGGTNCGVYAEIVTLDEAQE